MCLCDSTVTCWQLHGVPGGASSNITITVTMGSPATVSNTATLTDNRLRTGVCEIGLRLRPRSPQSRHYQQSSAAVVLGQLQVWNGLNGSRREGERQKTGLNGLSRGDGARVEGQSTLTPVRDCACEKSLDQHSGFHLRLARCKSAGIWLEDVELNGNADDCRGGVCRLGPSSTSNSSSRPQQTSARSATMQK